ncbi:hypothetical protein C4566_03380 [Candidatus Parcubacteria bacterium]|nr:MAG: hypothetical protein C4566_03380 [Candidatus Parcubacteria bacterium]
MKKKSEKLEQISATKQDIKNLEISIQGVLGAISTFATDVDKRFVGQDNKFISIDQRFDSVDQHFEAIDQRFDSMDSRIKENSLNIKRLVVKTDDILSSLAIFSQETEDRLSRLDVRMDYFDSGQEGIKLRLDNVAYRFEIKELDQRMKNLEQKPAR